jgi:DNA mismatch repair protein MutS
MALVKEYFELTKKYQDEYGENTILLMQVGSFMECYGLIDRSTNTIHSSKIQDFSRICELNIAEKNICIGKENVLMAGFTVSIIEKYIKKIQDAGYTCVVYTQDENVKNTTRSLAGIFSPGTYFQNDSTCLKFPYLHNYQLDGNNLRIPNIYKQIQTQEELVTTVSVLKSRGWELRS